MRNCECGMRKKKKRKRKKKSFTTEEGGKEKREKKKKKKRQQSYQDRCVTNYNLVTRERGKHASPLLGGTHKPSAKLV